MILRARHLFLAWLAYGALQLTLLGLGGVAGAQPAVGNRDARTPSESQSVSLGKRILASELGARHAPVTPFASSAHLRFDLPTLVGHEAPVDRPHRAEAHDPSVRPPARAPPALS